MNFPAIVLGWKGTGGLAPTLRLLLLAWQQYDFDERGKCWRMSRTMYKVNMKLRYATYRRELRTGRISSFPSSSFLSSPGKFSF